MHNQSQERRALRLAIPSTLYAQPIPLLVPIPLATLVNARSLAGILRPLCFVVIGVGSGPRENYVLFSKNVASPHVMWDEQRVLQVLLDLIGLRVRAPEGEHRQKRE